jgi:outer membrane protein assembly factor BamB
MKTKFLYFTLGLLILAFLLSGCSGGMTPSSWAGITSDGDTAYIAMATHVYAVRVSNGMERWRFPEKPDAKKTFFAAPTLTSDGQLIIGGYDRILYSLSPADGSVNWTFEDAKDHFIGSAVAGNDMIFAPSSDYNLYALDMQGKLVWKFTAGQALWGKPVVDDTNVYFGSMDHKVYALNMATGKTVWSTELDGSILGAITLGSDGVLYAGTLGDTVFALNTSSGSILWQQALSSRIWSAPVIGNGDLYVGDQAGMIVSLALDSGKENWSLQPDGPVLGSPLFLTDKVVFGTESGSLIAVDSEGKIAWSQTIVGKLYSTPVLAGDLILVAPVEGDVTLIALDQNGTQQWVYTPAK